MTEAEVYTVDEAAKLLKVSTETIRKLINSGELEANRVGRQYRIPRQALDKYLGKK